MKVLGQREKLEAVGAEAVFVVHDGAELVRRTMLHDLDVPFPVLVDPARVAYAAWGMRRSSVAGVWLDPRVWARYAVLLARGQRVRGLGGDTLQLGGDFVVDPAGRITYARPQQRDDRPSVLELVRHVRDAAGPPG